MLRRLRLPAAIAVGYLAGTLPSADLATRLATGGATDLRVAGSGNPGAANAVKVLGPRWGYAVMAADIGKGAAAAGIGRRVAGASGANAAGTAAVFGHCWPVWNGFRGGKGVATSVGQCVATFPAYTPIDLTIALVTSISPRWKQRAYAATVVASACWVGGAAVWAWRGWPNLWGPRPTKALPVAAAATSAVILSRFAAAKRATGAHPYAISGTSVRPSGEQ